MRIDLGKAALATAILLAAVRIHFSYQQLTNVLLSGSGSYSFFFAWVLNFAFVIPFPLLLYLLFRNSIVPGISAKQGYAAFGMAILIGLTLLPQMRELIWQFQQHYPGVEDMDASTEAAKILRWLQMASTQNLFWNTVNLMCGLAFIAFLAFLQFAPEEPTVPVNPALRSVRITALVSVLVGLLGLLSCFVQIGLALHRVDFANYLQMTHKTKGWFFADTAFAQLPLICFTLTSWIIFAGLPSGLLPAPAIPNSESPASSA